MTTWYQSGLKTLARCVALAAGVVAPHLWAGTWEQAKRMHDRLTGIPASPAVLQQMKILLDDGMGLQAAQVAMDNDAFYRVTLKNWAAPWTNREQNVFVPLNDYIATVIGLARYDQDFRKVLYDDIVYVADGVNPGYALNNNDHYVALENSHLRYQDALKPHTQSQYTGYPVESAAGVMTSRAGARAFFIDGTNRAQLRFTLMNFLCHDLEQLHDVTRVPDRIRQDVSRSPGGDARLFLNGCLGCHSGMDPLAQAFAYYDFEHDTTNDLTGENGRIRYNVAGVVDPKTGSRVQAKYRINSTTFPYGYITPDDHWDNYWRQGINQSLGWAPGGGSGNGASSLGRELANSTAFSQCQAKKAYKAVCLQELTDQTLLSDLVTRFSNGYKLKTLFAAAADSCKGD